LRETKVQRVLFHAFTSKYIAFAFVKCGCVFAAPHNVFVFDRWEHFATLQSSLHAVWARTYCSTLRTDVRYTRSSCFESYVFPVSIAQLAGIGREYHENRGRIMLARQEGLTKTYNRFHDPDETAEDIQKLRELHVEMDKAVAAAYGWTGLDLGHGFHETKQGLRFTISEAARQDALGRLLYLNHERHAQETAERGQREKRPRATRNKQPTQSELFD
jgi:hypothetical protein